MEQDLFAVNVVATAEPIEEAVRDPSATNPCQRGRFPSASREIARRLAAKDWPEGRQHPDSTMHNAIGSGTAASVDVSATCDSPKWGVFSLIVVQRNDVRPPMISLDSRSLFLVAPGT